MEPTEKMRKAAKEWKAHHDVYGTDPIAMVYRYLGVDLAHYTAGRKAKFSGPGRGKERVAEMEKAESEFVAAFLRAWQEA